LVFWLLILLLLLSTVYLYVRNWNSAQAGSFLVILLGGVATAFATIVFTTQEEINMDTFITTTLNDPKTNKMPMIYTGFDPSKKKEIRYVKYTDLQALADSQKVKGEGRVRVTLEYIVICNIFKYITERINPSTGVRIGTGSSGPFIQILKPNAVFPMTSKPTKITLTWMILRRIRS